MPLRRHRYLPLLLGRTARANGPRILVFFAHRLECGSGRDRFGGHSRVATRRTRRRVPWPARRLVGPPVELRRLRRPPRIDLADIRAMARTANRARNGRGRSRCRARRSAKCTSGPRIRHHRHAQSCVGHSGNRFGGHSRDGWHSERFPQRPRTSPMTCPRDCEDHEGTPDPTPSPHADVGRRPPGSIRRTFARWLAQRKVPAAAENEPDVVPARLRASRVHSVSDALSTSRRARATEESNRRTFPRLPDWVVAHERAGTMDARWTAAKG